MSLFTKGAPFVVGLMSLGSCTLHIRRFFQLNDLNGLMYLSQFSQKYTVWLPLDVLRHDVHFFPGRALPNDEILLQCSPKTNRNSHVNHYSMKSS